MTTDKSHTLPKDWKIIKLGELGTVSSGGTPSTRVAEYFDGEVPWITPADLTGYSSKYISKGHRNITELGLAKSSARLIAKGTVLFSSRAPIGYVAIAANDLCTNQGFKNLTPSGIIFNEYLYYYLKAAKTIAEDLACGTTFKEISAQGFSRIPVPIPPLPEQHRIVAKIEELFSDLDDGIASLKKAKEQLKVYRQSVLKWAFEGRLTNEDVKNGELPEGWNRVELSEISESIQYGFTESASIADIGPKFLRITDIQDGKVNWALVPYCKIGDDKLSKYVLAEGDLVFARTGATVGKSYLIQGNIPQAVFASYLIRVRVKKDINRKYIAYFFNSVDYWTQITEGQVGIGQPNVNGTKLGQLNVTVPSIHDQERIVQEIESRFSVADNLEQGIDESLQQSEALRQSILKRAFEGKLIPQE